MSQNRPDLIKRFIGVASNTIVHKILIKTELEDDLRKYYVKEIERDVDIAIIYRNRINPVNNELPQKDSRKIRNMILLKIKAELLKRKEKGYNIDFSLIDKETDKFLEKCKV